MILELATVLSLGYTPPQCPYLPIVDPPHGKLFCYVWTRLGNPPDRQYLKGVNLEGLFDAPPVREDEANPLASADLSAGGTCGVDVPERIGPGPGACIQESGAPPLVPHTGG